MTRLGFRYPKGSASAGAWEVPGAAGAEPFEELRRIITGEAGGAKGGDTESPSILVLLLLLDGPSRKLATASEARWYERRSASPSRRRLPLAGCLPLLFVEDFTSLRLVNPPGRSGFGTSIPMSTILLMSRTTSPPTAQPAVPYPPALMDGDNECFKQKSMTVLTSSASTGQTTAFASDFTFPLNIVVYSMKWGFPRMNTCPFSDAWSSS